jgi:hypothetical protein
MMNKVNLKEIERNAFRSTYQDGLWDMYYGLMLMSMAVFMLRPVGGYRPTNILLALACFSVSYLLFWLGKKYVTMPRMGQVVFGETRKKRNRTVIIILSGFVLIQVLLLLFTVFAWLDPQVGHRLNTYLKDRDIMDLAVAGIGALIVSSGMLLVAYFKDFPRGYYIAVLMSLAVFLMIYLNQPVYPIIIGGLIIVPGLALFIRFLKTHPRPMLEEAGNG